MTKKIMFSDRFGLTAAVLDGRKTMTRREPLFYDGSIVIARIGGKLYAYADTDAKEVLHRSHYAIGEVVAIAQSYKEVKQDLEMLYYGRKATDKQEHLYNILINLPYDHKGMNNKMFVRPDLMPHHIQITDIKVERLQDISDEDAIKEGIADKITPILYPCGNHVYTFEGNKGGSWYGNIQGYMTAKTAFAALIDKVSGKGTWDSNPWVFVYSFELID
jgi:hypothetical protein